MIKTNQLNDLNSLNVITNKNMSRIKKFLDEQYENDAETEQTSLRYLAKLIIDKYDVENILTDNADFKKTYDEHLENGTFNELMNLKNTSVFTKGIFNFIFYDINVNLYPRSEFYVGLSSPSYPYNIPEAYIFNSGVSVMADSPILNVSAKSIIWCDDYFIEDGRQLSPTTSDTIISHTNQNLYNLMSDNLRKKINLNLSKILGANSTEILNKCIFTNMNFYKPQTIYDGTPFENMNFDKILNLTLKKL